MGNAASSYSLMSLDGFALDRLVTNAPADLH